MEINLPSFSNLEAHFEKHTLKFIKPAKTSRETFYEKDTYLLKIKIKDSDEVGVGECSPLWTLSIDPKENYTKKLEWVCKNINKWEDFIYDDLKEYPSIQFGLESALLDLKNGGQRILFDSDFTAKKTNIKINGLVWMGDFEDMNLQINDKINQGFDCIKIKIGAIQWDKEIELLQQIRSVYSKDKLEIRVDANGAFEFDEAKEKLKTLSSLGIHSIEQPIKAGQEKLMMELCRISPIPIVLDEELIGIRDYNEKIELLKTIQPQYIILKPSLIGGFKQSNEWIRICNTLSIEWWLTSALEGNFGLNAISQFVGQKNNLLPQGLGTGQLYQNNFKAFSFLKGDRLCFNAY